MIEKNIKSPIFNFRHIFWPNNKNNLVSCKYQQLKLLIDFGFCPSLVFSLFDFARKSFKVFLLHFVMIRDTDSLVCYIMPSREVTLHLLVNYQIIQRAYWLMVFVLEIRTVLSVDNNRYRFNDIIANQQFWLTTANHLTTLCWTDVEFTCKIL